MRASRFDYFVLLAEMRTGSNHVEESLNAAPDLKCYGELFNPSFMGHHNLTSLFGVSMADRDANPTHLIQTIRANTNGLPGFRYFHDHDPRVYQAFMDDPRCAKIILTRDPVDSFVSLEIARQTGQWRLVDAKARKIAKITFDTKAFETRLTDLIGFQNKVRRHLQISGQTAFALRYEDICDLSVINGLAAWLGSETRLPSLPSRLLKQNSSKLADKVENFQQMEAYLQANGAESFSSLSTEPCGPGSVPKYLISDTNRLLFQPVAGSASDQLVAWLTALDDTPPVSGHTQKTLRRWMRRLPGFTSICVVRHPLLRAYSVFRDVMYQHADDALGPLRRLLEERLTPGSMDEAEAFRQFLLLASEVSDGQTRLHVPPAIATQASIIQGFAKVHPPHRIIRESDATYELAHLAPGPCFEPLDGADLNLIYSPEHEEIAAKVYRRDYVMFGFDRWRIELQ